MTWLLDAIQNMLRDEVEDPEMVTKAVLIYETMDSEGVPTLRVHETGLSQWEKLGMVESVRRNMAAEEVAWVMNEGGNLD